MNDFPTYPQNSAEEPGPDDESAESVREEFFSDNPNEIVTYAPKERFRLGYFDVACLVINRMIGTGIFNSPQRVMGGTNSVGASLLLWLGGTIWCLSGVHVYIEYGLNVPRYTIEGIEQSVPRSGGDLNYLQYVYRKPAYRRDTILLSTCLFGVAFISLGNMAGNCISFATRVLQAANIEDPSNGTVRGIAIGIATLTCFIHTFSRRGGLWLNNVFAIIKMLLLLLIIITAIVVAAGGLPNTRNEFSNNTKTSESFANASDDANGYAHAFLAILFGFSGFEQPNFVLGEISRPRKKFPIAMTVSVVTVALLYMGVNISYMVVVPSELQVDAGVAEQFFSMSLGKLGAGDSGTRIFNAFLAISSMGNIIVMTYTAARVKQEIAKEGILPFTKFFAQNRDMSLGRLLSWFEKKGMFRTLLSLRWLKPEDHTEKTPVGAFVLHLSSCFILIFATWGLPPDAAYNLLTTLSSYVINGFFGALLGLGILILRFRGAPITPGHNDGGPGTGPKAARSWSEVTGKQSSPFLSVACATIYMLGGLWPVVTSWIRPTGPSVNEYSDYAWWLIPTIGWSVIGLGLVWFLGFLAVARHIKRKSGTVLVIEKKPEFESAGGDGHHARPGTSAGNYGPRDLGEGARPDNQGYVLYHETVYRSWIAHETLRPRHPNGSKSNSGTSGAASSMAMSSAYDNPDFVAYMKQKAQQMPPSPSPPMHLPPHMRSPIQSPYQAYGRGEVYGPGAQARAGGGGYYQ